MSKLDIKEGKTYICKRDDIEWWTEGKEYKVQLSSNGLLYVMDDDGEKWYVTEEEEE